MIKLLTKLFGEQIRLVKMNKHTERRIIYEMAQIEGVDDYWQIQRVAGYELYGRTKDEKYLGYVQLSDLILKQLTQIRKPEELEEESSGYDSTV